MSHPKITSQKPNPCSSALLSFSSETYLPRRTPSTSKPPTLARVIPFASRLRIIGEPSYMNCRAPLPRFSPHQHPRHVGEGGHVVDIVAVGRNLDPQRGIRS